MAHDAGSVASFFVYTLVTTRKLGVPTVGA